MSKVNKNTFTPKQKPRKRALLHKIYSETKLKNGESIIMLGGPTPQYNFNSIKPNLNTMCKSIKRVKDSRLIPVFGNIEDVLHPIHGFTSSIEKIKFLDLDFCQTIKQLQRTPKLETSLNQLIEHDKLSDELQIMITHAMKSGRLCDNLKLIKKKYIDQFGNSNGWFKDYTINEVIRFVKKVFKKKYKNIAVKDNSYRDGMSMVAIFFKLSN